MAIFFTADQHFGHANVLKFCKRPFSSVEEMDSEMIGRWNSRVSSNDTIYIVGDLIWKGGKGFKRQIISQLNGKKIFILGNHDGKTKQPDSYLSLGFEKVYSHDLSITIDDESVLLCHYPYNPILSEWQILWYKMRNFWKFWRRDKYPFLKHLDKRPIDDGRWLLCGHVHNRWKKQGRSINVGVDVWNFYPVSLEEIKEIIRADS
jgi:calcineurin-like phosphoesterase family protein